MNFDIYGPYPIPRVKNKRGSLITQDSLSEMHRQIDYSDLTCGCGCYVFALRAAKGYTPWYVGQSAKMQLLPEALNPTNREKYNKILGDHTGTPVLFLIPKLTTGGKLAKPTRSKAGELKAVTFLEEWLIASALQKNPKLVNQKNTHFLKNLHVVGLFNAGVGESHSGSQELKRAIF